ncbi:hypothetical protein NS365_20600 [Aureimonas ureilytica]|uniref:Uncharacterized protein n=1 Tax=Aureimonas ureilytica TaxID=401562 RepID=A0A175RGE6_9HYPH|nr:hypothetical protein NS365_20600 [Aureimonas ureilytica]
MILQSLREDGEGWKLNRAMWPYQFGIRRALESQVFAADVSRDFARAALPLGNDESLIRREGAVFLAETPWKER